MSDRVSLRALADFLCARRERITSQWVERVREERTISTSDELPREALMDHLPKLFDNLTDQLRDADPGTHAKEAARDAQAHGENRWQQNYRLDELLREISVLRLIFMRHLVDFQAVYPGFVQETEWTADRIIHSFFDKLAIDSTEQFVARQQEELRLANHALAAANLKVEQFNDQLLAQDERRLQTLRTISHEVRNHLNGITMVVTILSKEPNPAVCHEYLEVLSRNLMDISSLTNQLLDFAGLLAGGERLELERCHPGPIYDELVLFFHEMARNKGLTFSATIDPAIGEVVTDRHKLHRIVMNLVTNAIKYTMHGEVQLSFLAGDSREWMVIVSDTGPGIPLAEVSHIFEEFHRIPQTTSGQPGAGLGLTITRQLVTLLRGRIEVESDVGRGTRFRVILPRETGQEL
jgi:signal transduction histidine kinase